MTETIYTDRVEIQGSQDVVQLEVQGHTTQTESLQAWKDSSDDPLAQITGDGRLQIGSFDMGAMATEDSLIEAHRDAADTAKPKRGLHLLGEVTGTLSDVVSWVVQELVLLGTGSISALHSALRVQLTNKNTGTMTNADLRAGDFEAINEGGSVGSPVTRMTAVRAAVTNQDGKYIADAIGVDVALSKETNGAITNAYGLRVQDVDQGSTANYALHTGKGQVHLGDVLELVEQAAAPNGATGLMRVYPKTDGRLYAKNAAGTEYDLTGGSGSAPIAGISNGRLTLSSGTPIPSTDVLAGTTLYFTPFQGNQVALYDGSEWALHVFTESSLSLSGLDANTLYDVFIYDNAGTLTLEAVAWNAPDGGSITSISNAVPLQTNSDTQMG